MLADKLNKAYPEDTQVQATYVPTLRALSAMASGNPQSAVQLLEPNRRYEFAIPPLAFNHFYGNMYPIYVRGLAYLAMNRSHDAAKEFRRLLDHQDCTRAIQSNPPRGSSLRARRCLTATKQRRKTQTGSCSRSGRMLVQLCHFSKWRKPLKPDFYTTV